MKIVTADLMSNVVSVYDKTKTTIFGRVSQKTVNSRSVLGPPLTKFIDVFTDSGTAPVGVAQKLTSNGRLFVLGAITGGAAQVMLYTFNLTTGATSYVGKIQVPFANTAATTHTVRGFKVVDNGTTGWKIFIETTGSVAVNGGLYMVNDIALSDFVPIGFPIIPFATGTNQKAMYFLQDPANIGAGQLQTASAGLVLDMANQKAYAHNGTAATHQYYVYDYSIAPTSPSNTVTITIATPGVVSDAGHAYNANDQIVLSTTGSLPTGLVAGTVYFVRNPVAGVSYELSATSGGASINTTGAQSGVHTARRASGRTGSLFSHKTGNLPALTGTLLLTNAEDFAVPAHTANAGFDCVSFGTTTNIYIGKLSELTVGATTWPSLLTANILGAANQITAPTATNLTWVQSADSWLYISGTNIIGKQLVNNSINKLFGASLADYYEGNSFPNGVSFGAQTLNGIEAQSGWVLISSTTVGQRGLVAIDALSDFNLDQSVITTKVLDTSNSQYKALSQLVEIVNQTDGLQFFYRSAATESDPLFNSPTGGWINLAAASDLSAVSTLAFTQLKIAFRSDNRGNYRQVYELHLAIESLFENDEHWEVAGTYSSSGVPVTVVWRLKKAFVGSVPTMFYRAYDLNGAGPLTPGVQDTVTNAANFSYSTDDNGSYNPLGTIPNVVGTLLKYTYNTPPGVKFRPSLRRA